MPVPVPLISDISQGRCLPFVGAGFSKNASLPDGLAMPDWPELAAILAKTAETDGGAAPPVIAQRYEQRFGRVQLVEAIRESLHSDRARPGKAHLAFAQLPFDTVYTTNFDLLLESAYTQEKRPHRSLVGELQLPFHAGQIASSVIKMHGDLLHEEHIIVTQSDYETFMEQYPVVATHLSAMLITRTPLFVGYSLSDPDFDNIRRVVRSRLGTFERMAYIVQFDVAEHEIESALRDKLHIISLDTSTGRSRDELLADLFGEIQEQLDSKAASRLRASRPDVFEAVEAEVIQRAVRSRESATVMEATSRLCFVMMPFGRSYDGVYRSMIAPTAAEQGLAVLRADEMSGSGFVMEQIRTAIQQSRLCIADISDNNANVLYEVGFANALGKAIVLLARRGSDLPFDVAHQRVVLYDDDLVSSRSSLERAVVFALSAERLAEAARLFDMGAYQGAIAAAFVVLEQHLRRLAIPRSTGAASRLTFGRMIAELREAGIIREEAAHSLAQVIEVRNHTVHSVEVPSRNDAELVLTTVRKFLDDSLPLDPASEGAPT
jgi:SIR2-like protein/uncharacterized protein DUF4145